jgi:spore coat protein JB
MDDKMSRGCCGVLPAQAPLANPYVPFQANGPEQYPAKTGLIRGTLFPCLDLPFLGMVNTEEKSDTLLHQLQALGFAVQELGLYLDTHADDAEAVELFRQYTELYETGMAQYQQSCGPLFQKQAAQNGAYTWNSTPWPWEYSANKED